MSVQRFIQNKIDNNIILPIIITLFTTVNQSIWSTFVWIQVRSSAALLGRILRKILYYIHLDNVNKRHADATASTDPKKLGALQRQKVDPWIAPVSMERSMVQQFVKHTPGYLDECRVGF